jgi:hypothetical protein
LHWFEELFVELEVDDVMLLPLVEELFDGAELCEESSLPCETELLILLVSDP